MTKHFDYRIVVNVSPNASLTITTVLSAPRKCTPAEVLSACQSIEFTCVPESFPRQWSDFAAFILKDFFVLAHRSGLYNRQLSLWSAIGRITSIKAQRPQRGIFTVVDAPYAELSFYDNRGNRLIWSTLLDSSSDATLSTDKHLKTFITEAIQRAEKIQRKESSLRGIFIGLPAPISPKVLDLVAHLTKSSDPVGRYESLLAPPLQIPLNLISMTPNPDSPTKVSLIHPPLRQPKPAEAS